MMANLHTVAMYGEHLGVRCLSCDHRAVFGADRLPIRQGNMTPLYRLKFRCQMCGAKNQGEVREKVFALYIPFSTDDPNDFLTGKDFENRRASN